MWLRFEHFSSFKQDSFFEVELACMFTRCLESLVERLVDPCCVIPRVPLGPSVSKCMEYNMAFWCEYIERTHQLHKYQHVVECFLVSGFPEGLQSLQGLLNSLGIPQARVLASGPFKGP